ncbi:MAG: zinc ribbon domain-containing protein [Formivibrio sp.]|nr:zinc ribbon domain-containing protein [Formivibrio sp.]
MALQKCRECGTEVSSEAKSCPKCGIAKPVKPKSQLPKVIAWIFGLSFLGIFVAGITGKSINAPVAAAPAPAVAKKDSPTDPLPFLAQKCIQGIRQVLHDPESAQLPDPILDYPAKFAKNVNGKNYAIQFEFRAKNAFNATRLSTAECKWKKVGEDFEPVSVKSW